MSKVLTGTRVPLYRQVAQTLRQRVRTGHYGTDDSLPTMRTLSEEFGVSLKVVYQAVRELEAERVVVCHYGKGVQVVDRDRCDRAAIVFGVVHPYLRSMGFHRDVLEYIDDAFAERSNLAVVRSSKDDAAQERQIAQHLIDNGVSGLIVWPVEDDPNGPFFAEVSQDVPVVLVDRLLPEVELPAVLLDGFGCGREVSQTLLGQMGRRRMLVLMDDLRISSYQDVWAGIERGAAELGRSEDVAIVEMPISRRLIQKVNVADFSEVGTLGRQVRRLILEGDFDAIFCTQDEFIDYALAQTGLIREFPNLAIATRRNVGPNERSMSYCSLSPLEWYSDSGRMISAAADMVQRWAMTRQMPKEVIRLKLTLQRRNHDGA